MKLHKGFVLWMLTLTLSALIAGCTPLGTVLSGTDDDTTATGIDLVDTTWTLIKMNGEAVTALAEASLDFATEQISGIAFCNRFFGPYEQDGATLSFGMLGSTMMACPDMEHEGQYFEALGTVAGYRIDADDLVLTDADGDAVLVFSPAKQAALEGTVWHLTGYNTGNAISSLILDTEITATLTDGQIEGSAGCNGYFASYTLDGPHIEMGPVANTEMYCMEPEGVMDQEMDYLVALATAAMYDIDRDTLTILNAEGMRLLTYSAISE
ncbi:MAG: META domain-containing protein [Anaerolineae bacterium]|nr:META domain-containing protein [Anaerolineae bacterium]